MKYRVTVVVWDKLSIQGTTIPALNREFVQNHHGHLVACSTRVIYGPLRQSRVTELANLTKVTK